MANAEKDFALVGFGYENYLKRRRNRNAPIEQLFKKEAATRFQNMSISGTGALLFGGLPLIQNKRLLRPGES